MVTRIEPSFLAAWRAAGAVANAGTSEGAKAGWETRRLGLQKQVARTGIIEHEDGETSTRVLPSESKAGHFDIWSSKGGVRRMVSDPNNPLSLSDAHGRAVEHAMGSAAPATETAVAVAATQPPAKPVAKGMTVEEARKHLADRAKLGVFGMPWDELEKVQGGKLRGIPNSGTSEGSIKGWATRRSGHAADRMKAIRELADGMRRGFVTGRENGIDYAIRKTAERETPDLEAKSGKEHLPMWRDEVVAQLDREPMPAPQPGFEAVAARTVAKELTYPEGTFSAPKSHSHAGLLEDAAWVRKEAVAALASGNRARMAGVVGHFNSLVSDLKGREKDDHNERYIEDRSALARDKANKNPFAKRPMSFGNSKPCGDSHIPDGHTCRVGETTAERTPPEVRAAAQKAKEKGIASTVMQQIRATDPMAMMAWGTKDATILAAKQMADGGWRRGGLQFGVNGAAHGRGIVRVHLMHNDTYTVDAGKVRRGVYQVKERKEDVYADNLMSVIDRIVEGDGLPNRAADPVANCDYGCGKCDTKKDGDKLVNEDEEAVEMANRAKPKPATAPVAVKPATENETVVPLHDLSGVKRESVANAGTSDGANKGWETRRREIATKHSGDSEWGSLVPKNRDDDDFRDLHVDGISSALADAFSEGSGGVKPSAAQLASLAKQHLAVDSLQPQGRDRGDFHQISKQWMSAALDGAKKIGAKVRNDSRSCSEIVVNLPSSAITNRFMPPADGWIQVAPYGAHPHSRGVVQVIDEASAQAMVNAIKQEQARPNFAGVLVDYDHNSLSNERPSEAAGWIQDLQARPDGMWGQVRWSDKGQEAVEGGRYRFVSPVWQTTDCQTLDSNNIRPLRLDSLALTNDPNMKDMVPISA